MALLAFALAVTGVTVRQLDENGVAVTPEPQAEAALLPIPSPAPDSADLPAAPLGAVVAEPMANEGDECVSVAPGTTDNWCQLTCSVQACPETLCKCGSDEQALNASKVEAAAAGQLGGPVDAQKWDSTVTTNASCVSIQIGTTDNWCQISCGTEAGCPDTLCKCGVEAASKKKEEDDALMSKACDFDADGCIDKNGIKDCRTCALHFTDCMASPHLDDSGAPKIYSLDDCIDEISDLAKGCSECKSKDSKAAWRLRVGDAQAP